MSARPYGCTPSASDVLTEWSCRCWPRWLTWNTCGVRVPANPTPHPDKFGYSYRSISRQASGSEPDSDAFLDARSQNSEELADDPPISVNDLNQVELEWRVAERGLQPVELDKLREMRNLVARNGLDDHPSCALVPHSQRAITLLRFLRARNGDISKAAALLESALDWRREFDFDRKLAEWRSEWEAAVSPRTRLLRRYDFIQLLGNDRDGLPVYLHRFSQGDAGGLARELGEDTLLLHLLRILDDSFAAAQAWLLKTGRIPKGFVDIYDVGNYGLVPGWLQRGLAAASPYTKFAPIFDKVFPERVRVAFILRAPMAFSMIWKMALPLVPDNTRDKIHLKGFQASSWKDEMTRVLPEDIIPLWLLVDDAANFAHAKPWGGTVPKDALLQEQ